MSVMWILKGMLLVFVLPTVYSRGRMIEPPQRSSLWRQYPSAPINYDDHTLNCGGYWRHMFLNGGKCGVCGDRWDLKPRPNEIGGKYANGFIPRNYLASDEYIYVIIEVTSSIGGYFEFRLCPHDSHKKPVTQECLDEGQLIIKNHGPRYYLPYYPFGLYYHQLELRIPENMSCKQCVLQWKWHGRYYWGHCTYGYDSSIGCGAQEEYYNCADIEIIGKKTTEDNTATKYTTTTATTTDVTENEEKRTTYASSSYKTSTSTTEAQTSQQYRLSTELESNLTHGGYSTLTTPTEQTTDGYVTNSEVKTSFTSNTTPASTSGSRITDAVIKNSLTSSTITPDTNPSTDSTLIESTKAQGFSTIPTIDTQTDDKQYSPTTVFAETTTFPYTTTSERHTTYSTRRTTLFKLPEIPEPIAVR